MHGLSTPNLRRTFSAYALAALTALGALALQALDPPFFKEVPYFLLWPAVLLSGWRWGPGPGLLAALVCSVGGGTGGVKGASFFLVSSFFCVLLGRAREQVRISEHKFTTIYEHAPFPIVLVKMPSTVIANVNQAFVDLLGPTKEEAVGKTSVELGLHQDIEARNRIRQEFQRAGRVRGLESRNVSRAGKPLTIENYIDPIELEGQKYALVTLRDTTEQRRVQNDLHEAIRTRDEFLSIASHELKTPLTPALLQIQMLLRSVGGSKDATLSKEKVVRAGESIEQQIKRLAALVEELLDVSRVRSGKLTLSPEQVDLSRLFSEAIDQFVPELTAARCEVHRDVAPGISGLLDRTRLEQVVSNLISNAIKYAPGSPVFFRLKPGQAARTARIEVEDLGPGIPEAEKERIFSRFERAGAHHTKIAGLGLGLYISRQIIEAHGGRIFVEPKPAPGSLFVVELPLRAK